MANMGPLWCAELPGRVEDVASTRVGGSGSQIRRRACRRVRRLEAEASAWAGGSGGEGMGGFVGERTHGQIQWQVHEW